MHADAERAQHDRSASHGRYADRPPGSRTQTDKAGYDSAERRAGGRIDMGSPPARLNARRQHTGDSRQEHRQPVDRADIMAPPR